MSVCPVCLLPRCERPHPECSPPHGQQTTTDPTRPRPTAYCNGCSARLRVPSNDGLCGFCRVEMVAILERVA